MTNQTTDSILDSIKKLLGMPSCYDAFETDIIMHINTVFANLAQMGVCPDDKGFQITDNSTTWSEFTNDDILMNNVKTYVYLKVRLIFDPPANATLVDSINSQIDELEYRLYTQKGGY